MAKVTCTIKTSKTGYVGIKFDPSITEMQRLAMLDGKSLSMVHGYAAAVSVTFNRLLKSREFAYSHKLTDDQVVITLTDKPDGGVSANFEPSMRVLSRDKDALSYGYAAAAAISILNKSKEFDLLAAKTDGESKRIFIPEDLKK